MRYLLSPLLRRACTVQSMYRHLRYRPGIPQTENRLCRDRDIPPLDGRAMLRCRTGHAASGTPACAARTPTLDTFVFQRAAAELLRSDDFVEQAVRILAREVWRLVWGRAWWSRLQKYRWRHAPKLQANRNMPSASAANGSEAANVQAYEMLNHAYARRSRKCRRTTKCSSSPTWTGRKKQEGQVYTNAPAMHRANKCYRCSRPGLQLLAHSEHWVQRKSMGPAATKKPQLRKIQ